MRLERNKMGRARAAAALAALACLTFVLCAGARTALAQGNGDPVVICEYCDGLGNSGTPPGQQPPSGGQGYATATNSSGVTMRFPLSSYPASQVSGLSPMSPANAAKLSLPMGYTIVGQTSGGDPVVRRPDGSYVSIQLSQGTPVSNATGGPEPTASPSPAVPWDAGYPSGQMIKLLDHVRELIPYIRRQIERPLLEKFSFLAMITASVILLFSFIRVIRENDGASRELYFWFGRAVLCMMLFTVSPSIVSTLYKIGRTLTIPIEGEIEERRTAFDDQYRAFIHGHFVVRDDKNVFIEPMYIQPGEYGWVGILTDQESGKGRVTGIQAIESVTDLSGWSMPKLFFGLNLARGVLQAGDIFLLVLGGFIMIGLRLAAPFMVAAGIDQKLAQRITYPYIWGTVVFTLIFPVVREVLTFIAYTVGSFGLSLYDGTSPYTIDPTTSLILKNNPYEPTFVIILTMVIMLINGLMLWASPYLAYRIATGQLFEAVSSTASGWMAAIVGSAIEYTGLKAGASLQRQAENTQTQGAYQAETTRARGTLEAANLGAQARKISGLANVEGSRQATLAAISGGAQTARGMAQANANFTVAATRAQVADSNRQVGTRADQSINQTRYSQGAESLRIAAESRARKQEIWGGASSAIPYAGTGVINPLFQNVANGNRTRALNEANNTFSQNTISNEQRTATSVQQSQTTYQGDMETATQQQLGASTAAINEGAGIAAGGANRGAAISAGGINKAYALEVKANDVQFNAATEAAGQVKDANMEAANLRELSTVVSGVARDMDRRIEEGMRQRY